MTRNEIVVLARESGFETELFNSIDGDEVVVGYTTITDLLVKFANLIAEKEREACAQIADGFYWHIRQYTTDVPEIGFAIRARGQK